MRLSFKSVIKPILEYFQKSTRVRSFRIGLLELAIGRRDYLLHCRHTFGTKFFARTQMRRNHGQASGFLLRSAAYQESIGRDPKPAHQRSKTVYIGTLALGHSQETCSVGQSDVIEVDDVDDLREASAMARP